MVDLYITGHNPRKRVLQDVLTWFIQKYLPRHYLEIEVHHRGLLREGVWGWCDVVDCNWRPRSFLIEIHNRLSTEDYIKTLCHELVHVKQIIKGDLKTKRGKRYWKGIEIEDDYENDPSEIEAHSMESILYQEYLLDNPTKSR